MAADDMAVTLWQSCDFLQSATATPPVQPQHPHPPIPSLNEWQVLHSQPSIHPKHLSFLLFPLNFYPLFVTHVLMRIHPESVSGCEKKVMQSPSIPSIFLSSHQKTLFVIHVSGLRSYLCMTLSMVAYKIEGKRTKVRGDSVKQREDGNGWLWRMKRRVRAGFRIQ